MSLRPTYFPSRPRNCFLPAAKQRLKKKGSRYIYDLYYGKEAISKQLYEWLLKNNYADANLIAKWKKQGYEKVCLPRIVHPFLKSRSNSYVCSCVAFAVFKPRKPISTPLVSVECRKPSLKRTKWSNVSAADVEAVEVAIRISNSQEKGAKRMEIYMRTPPFPRKHVMIFTWGLFCIWDRTPTGWRLGYCVLYWRLGTTEFSWLSLYLTLSIRLSHLHYT